MQDVNIIMVLVRNIHVLISTVLNVLPIVYYRDQVVKIHNHVHNIPLKIVILDLLVN
jgi:hypothetical protein